MTNCKNEFRINKCLITSYIPSKEKFWGLVNPTLLTGLATCIIKIMNQLGISQGTILSDLHCQPHPPALPPSLCQGRMHTSLNFVVGEEMLLWAKWDFHKASHIFGGALAIFSYLYQEN